MLCTDFEDRLTDYLDGALDAQTNSAFAAHAMRCPVCHELLGEVKNAMQACRVADVPLPPSVGLETKILMQTAPQALMTCEEFEEHLTDYLDGFLPAPLFHRWERHAALCANCTELPGQVVRSIGACYTYINELKPVPVGLHERILQATLGTTEAEEVRAPWPARLAARLRELLDPIISPQLATVATMLLVAVMVLTSTVSADGSISGMYRASLQLAERTYAHGTTTAVKGAALSGELKQIADGVTTFMTLDANSNSSNKEKAGETPKPENIPATTDAEQKSNK
jgi:anti-sigma factor RsiW